MPGASGSSSPQRPAAAAELDVVVVIVNYGTPELTTRCLASMQDELRGIGQAVVVDNASGDGSAERIEAEIRERGWGSWARVVRSVTNGGFSWGNNLGIGELRARAYFLVNSDVQLLPGATELLLRELEEHPGVGLVGPRLQGPEGAPQVSVFRNPTPLTELLRAAGTGLLDRTFSRHVTAIPVSDAPIEADWISFAAVMLRREVFDGIGKLDANYFMFFEDVDYCRRARRAGWRVRYCPGARAVHLRGRSSPVKSLQAARKRLPRYYYASRARYYAKFYGRAGLWVANALWMAGRAVSFSRELLGRRRPHVAEREMLDNWTGCWNPMQPPDPGGSQEVSSLPGRERGSGRV